MAFIRRPIQPPVQAPRLPASFSSAGFVPPQQARMRGGSKFRGLMLALEGRSDTGKTEFSMSAPGPGLILACDRGFDAVFDNQTPPTTRRPDFGIKTLQMPTATDFTSNRDYVPYYAEFVKSLYAGLAIPEARTLVVDGDNYTWDLQRLAEWGRLTGIFPQTKYADPKAARMSLYFKMWESGKVIIATNMMQQEWKDQMGADGQPIVDDKGERRREPTGDYVAKGFPDQEYLWSLRCRTLHRAGMTKKHVFGPKKGETYTTEPQWGLRIVKAKANPALVGEELWAERCNFPSLVQLVYPHVQLEEWGF